MSKANLEKIINIAWNDKENISSHSWQKDCGISIMKLHSEKEWKVFFENAGL